MKKILYFLLFILIITSCKNEKTSVNTENFTVRIGINKDPAAIFPLKRNGKTERPINVNIFSQACDFDPISLENIPVLLKEVPNEISIDTGKYINSYRYDLEFKKDATWDNGTPITALDYIFTVKLMLNPLAEIHPAIRSLYSKIKGIEIDPNKNKAFSVFADNDYLLSKEMVTNLDIYPEYFYDSLRVLRNIDIATLKNNDKAKATLEKIDSTNNFAKKINSVHFMRNYISGAGPFKFNEWESGQYISLKKKKNWWGDKYDNISYLKNNPDEIVFKIIPDKTTSLTELKNGNIDMLSGVEGSDFIKMKNDPKYKDKFNFYNPLSMQFYIIALNNRNPILKDKNMRKALAHMVDVDFLIKTFGTGDDKRLCSPIHPSKKYYNNNLKPINIDIEKAKELILKSGWADSNKDGIYDKLIEGNLTDLKLSIMITGKALGKSIALMLKENASKVGMQIEIVNKTNKELRNNLKKADFDIAPGVSSKDMVDYDPYAKYHSDNSAPGGSNRNGFSNQKCDELIEKIRNTRDNTIRQKYYKEFQELIYNEQPVIFLYVPTNNIIINNKFKIKPSVKRPGYFANTIELNVQG